MPKSLVRLEQRYFSSLYGSSAITAQSVAGLAAKAAQVVALAECGDIGPSTPVSGELAIEVVALVAALFGATLGRLRKA